AEETKTEEQAAIWGGTVGDWFDPCYHQACDTLDNVDRDAIEVNSDVIAFATLTFAYSTEDVNGVPGRRVPGRPFHLPDPAGPEGTFGGGGGGAGPAHGARGPAAGRQPAQPAGRPPGAGPPAPGPGGQASAARSAAAAASVAALPSGTRSRMAKKPWITPS